MNDTNTRTTNAQLGSEAGARSRPKAATRRLMLAALALALGCSGESSDDEPSLSRLEEPLLADHAACKDGRLDTLANACLRANEQHAVTQVDLLAAVPTRPVLVGPTYSVRLAQNGDLSEGQVVFTPNVSGEYVFYLGTPNVPFSLERQDDAVTPICTRYISSTLATDLTGESCERVRGAYVAELDAGESYAVKFGPINARTVRLIIELRRKSGASLGTSPLCNRPRLSALGALCAQSTPTQPLRGTRMDEVDAADVSVGQAYGVHLQSLGGENEASVEFVPPHTGDYLIGLGTPNVGLYLRAADAEVAPSCAISVTTELADTLGAGDCSAIKGVFSARLSGGVSTRLELGRTAAASWERLVIVPAAPDSDGDGLADNLDGCPADTNKVEPGICGCGVSDEGPDSEGDGIPDQCDACPALPGTDQDDDTVCDAEDNCPRTSNADQTDADGNGRGDVCEQATVGYYNLVDGHGTPGQEQAITLAGHLPVNITTLDPQALATIDVLFANNGSNFAYASTYAQQTGAIAQAVQNGMVLVLHDRFVAGAEAVLPGGESFNIIRDFTDEFNIEIVNGSTLVTDGPGGLLNATSLDNGSSSSHGFAVAGTLPGDSTAILSRTSAAELVTFCYRYGLGAVVYSTIPLDYYVDSSNGPGPASFRSVYAPNVVAYAASGACSE